MYDLNFKNSDRYSFDLDNENSKKEERKERKKKAALDESIRAYACLENYVAFRSPEGAEFIECVHKVFLEYADKENIDDLLKRVRSYTTVGNL